MSTLLEAAEEVRAAAPIPETFAIHQACAAKRYLEYVIAKHTGNITKAAAEAGMCRQEMHRKIQKFGVRYESRLHRGNWGAS